MVVTDTTWRLTTDGPIIANNEFDGEEYDASKELGKWSEAGYDDSAWMNARSVGAPEGALHAQRNPNIRVMEEIDPVAISQLNDSTYILDMGQNMVGWLNVTLKGEKGEPVRLRFAETLKPDGQSLYGQSEGSESDPTSIFRPETTSSRGSLASLTTASASSRSRA